MKFRGTAHKFGDNINTDYIISVKRKMDTIDDSELAKYILEDLDPQFYSKITAGDFIVAGKNFGCGSSREAAPRVIKAAGIKAVIAKSFARIFYRNAINIGLMLVECDTDQIENHDYLEIDIAKGLILNETNKKLIKLKPLSPIILEIYKNEGLIGYIKSRKDSGKNIKHLEF